MHLTLLLRAPQMTLLFRFNFVLNYINDYLRGSLILKANGPPSPLYPGCFFDVWSVGSHSHSPFALSINIPVAELHKLQKQFTLSSFADLQSEDRGKVKELSQISICVCVFHLP